MTSVSTATTESDAQQLLSHLATHLLHELGGDIPLETLHLRSTDHLDLSATEVAELINQGQNDGIYEVTRGTDGAKHVTGVTPIGEPPAAVAALTSDDNTADPAATFDDIDGIGETTANRLHEAGYESFSDLYAATPPDLADIPTMTEAKAQHIINQAGQFVAADQHLAQEALARYHQHTERWGDTQAVIQPILDVDQDVGDPLALTDTTVPAEETHYHGLPVLTDVDHPHMVQAADFPQCDGKPIVPKATMMDMVGLDTDVATAQKLARGNHGLRLVGPHGCGKNYTLKHIHYQTNRVLVSIDADSSMLAQDVLGVSTVNDDRVVVFRDGVLTQAMKHGYTLVINEANVAPPGIMMALQEVLNENVLTVKESGETIIPHPAARIVITMNPPTREYRGSEPLNAATRDRFQTVYFDYLDEQDEIDLLDQLANSARQRVDRDDIRRLVEVATATRTNETWPTLSTRTLEHAIDWIDEGASVRGALKHVVQTAAEPHQQPTDTHETIDDV
jgi:nitric oxide reductase NorQ protein